jgi:hypothetical protein
VRVYLLIVIAYSELVDLTVSFLTFRNVPREHIFDVRSNLLTKEFQLFLRQRVRFRFW